MISISGLHLYDSMVNLTGPGLGAAMAVVAMRAVARRTERNFILSMGSLGCLMNGLLFARDFGDGQPVDELR